MTPHGIFTDLEEKYATQLWDRQPISLGHRLHESPLFQRDTLATLIDNYPKDEYQLTHMGEQNGDRRYWKEGDMNGLSGNKVIEAISKGRLWLNLRNTHKVDTRYRVLLETIIDELRERIPGFASYNEKLEILISSPNAQVYYHVDNPGQMLFQIAGYKRVYVYPPKKPFLTIEDLKYAAMPGLDYKVSYVDWYDKYARISEAEPGQMLHWPLNSPHLVENHDALSISMTIEYFYGEIHRSHVVSRANWLLRHKFGLAPRNRATRGPIFWAKAATWLACRKSPWVEKQKLFRKAIQFQLDETAPGMIRETTTSVDGWPIYGHEQTAPGK
jgi:hypothetical protein